VGAPPQLFTTFGVAAMTTPAGNASENVREVRTGEPAGFVIPAHNGYSPIIAYLAVVPAHRGHGYIADILAEGTRVLAAQDVPFIKAATDLGNVPMAAAFHRAGWRTTGHRIDMTWEAPG